jgi:hypothetical protein
MEPPVVPRSGSAHVRGHRSDDRRGEQPAGTGRAAAPTQQGHEALLGASFNFDPEDPAYHKTGNETRYTIYRLPYETTVIGEGALRPTIQIETAVWPLRVPAIELPLMSSRRKPSSAPRGRKDSVRVDPRDGSG